VNDDRIAEPGRGSNSPDTAAPEPPHVYYLACGEQCDVFWWARRKTAADRARDPQQPPPKSD
jgi:hypothetical protein